MTLYAALLLRSTRALVGLVTIWCLGCASFEPLLASLLGGSASTLMSCDLEIQAGSVATSGATDAHSIGTVSPTTQSRSFDCGCGGACHAPSPASKAPATSVSPLARIAQFEPSAPLSVVRIPLVPPPKLAA